MVPTSVLQLWGAIAQMYGLGLTSDDLVVVGRSASFVDLAHESLGGPRDSTNRLVRVMGLAVLVDETEPEGLLHVEERRWRTPPR